MMTWMEQGSNFEIKSSASGCYLPFAKFSVKFSLVLLVKMLLIKKACIRSFAKLNQRSFVRMSSSRKVV